MSVADFGLKTIAFVGAEASKAILGSEAAQRLGDGRSGIMARLASRAGLLRRRDLERALRIAHLQALDLLLRRYERMRRETTEGRELLDEGRDASGFIRDVRAFLRGSFTRSLSVDLGEELSKTALSAIGENFPEEALDLEAPQDANQALLAVEAELLHRTRREAPPPRFLDLLRSGDGGAVPSWPTAYRAFLCARFKADPQLLEILSAFLLEDLREAIADQTQASAQIGEALERAFEEARNKTGAIGLRLGEIEARIAEFCGGFAEWRARFGAIEASLAEMAAADPLDPLEKITADSQKILDGACRRMGEGAFAASLARVAEIQKEPFFGRYDDLQTLSDVLDKHDRGLIRLVANAGLGKSRFLTLWSDALAEPGLILLRHFISSRHPETTSGAELRRSLLRQAAMRLGPQVLGRDAPEEDRDVRRRLAELLCEDRPAGERLIVVIDSLDESPDWVEPPFWDLGRGVYVVASASVEAGEQPGFLQDWRSMRKGRGWLRYRAKAASFEHRLEPLDEAAIADWLSWASARRIASEDPLIGAVLRASDGAPLFARFLIPDAIEALRRGVPDEKAFPPGFQDYAKREVELLDRGSGSGGGRTVHDLFTLLTVTLGPIGERDLRMILPDAPELASLDRRFARWLLIRPGEDGELQLSFAHPRLAGVFREVLPLADREGMERRLVEFCAASWRLGGGPHASAYALRWLPHSLIADGERTAAADLLANPDFIAARLSLPDAAGLLRRTASETLKLLHDKRLGWWAAFWANAAPLIHQAITRGKRGYAAPSAVFAQLYSETAMEKGEMESPAFVRSVEGPLSFPHPNLRLAIDDAHRGWIGGVRPFGEGLVSWGQDGALRFWSAEGAPMPGGDREAHDGEVRGVLPFGAGLVSWEGQKVRFWTAEGAPTGARNPHRYTINGVRSFGQRLVSWGLHDGTVRFWTANGEPAGGGKAHDGEVRGVLPFGAGFVSWGGDGALRFWTAEGDLAPGGEDRAHLRGVGGVAPFGAGLVSWGSRDGAMRFWDAEGAPAPGGARDVYRNGVRWGGVLSFGAGLVTWGGDGALRFWDAEGAPAPGGDLKAHRGEIKGVLPFGAGLVTWGEDGALRFWDAEGAPAPGGDLKAHWSGIYGVLPFGEGLVSWSSWTLRFWDAEGAPAPGGILVARRRGGIGGVLPFGAGLVSWGSDGDLCFWSAEDEPAPRGARAAHAGSVVGVLPFGAGFVTWSGGGALRFWDAEGAPAPGGDPQAHQTAIRGVRPFGAGLVSWSDDGTLRFWDAEGEPMPGGSRQAHQKAIRGVRPFGAGLVSWSEDGTLRFWSAEGEPMPGGIHKAQRRGIGGVLPFGAGLVSWSGDGALRFWNADGSPAPGGELKAHRVAIRGVFPFGAGLVSWGDTALRFWNADGSPAPGGDLKAHPGGIEGVFPFGAGLVSWGCDKALRFWSADGSPAPGGARDVYREGYSWDIMPFGEGLVSWGGDGALRFWSAEGAPMPGGGLKAHERGIRGVLPFGAGLVSWSFDGTLRFWSAEGAPMPGGGLKAHERGIQGVFPFGEGLVSWGGAGLRFWSAEGAPAGGDREAHPGEIKGVLPFGAGLVSWSADGTLLFWSADGRLEGEWHAPEPVSFVGSVGSNLVVTSGSNFIVLKKTSPRV